MLFNLLNELWKKANDNISEHIITFSKGVSIIQYHEY